jgi:5-methylcytosine-specific restriction endonuclease McrA
VTVFDIQAAALMNQSPAKVQQAAEQIRELFLFTILTDQEIKDATSRRTGSSLQTKIRFNKFATLVEPIFKGTVTEPRFFDYAYRFSLWENSHTCKICNNEIHIFEDCTVDHIEPYSKGGKTVAGNAQLAHRFCNARKNDSYNSPPDAPQ